MHHLVEPVYVQLLEHIYVCAEALPDVFQGDDGLRVPSFFDTGSRQTLYKGTMLVPCS